MVLTSVIKKGKHLVKRLDLIKRKKEGLRKLCEASNTGFPEVLVVPTRFMISGQMPERAKLLSDRIENIRSSIAAHVDMNATVIYSPSPGATHENYEGQAIPKEGDFKKFSFKKLAMETSLSKQQGIFVMLCANESKAKTILELGSCVGVGSAYLASSEHCLDFYTVEGSSELAAVAEKSIKEIRSGPFRVCNALFDEALDELLPTMSIGIDMVWIDGHHEKLATLYYLNRLKPYLNCGAMVLFDDIYWSDDMLEAWKEVQKEPGFSDCVSLGSLGVCLWDNSFEKSRIWNFESYIGGGVWNPAKLVSHSTVSE